MSANLERLRRLQRLRDQSSRFSAEPRRPLAIASGDDGAPAAPRPPAVAGGYSLAPASPHLEEQAPGVLAHTAAGSCYLVTTAWPLAEPRGPLPLGALLEPRSPSFPAGYGIAADADFRRAAFLDTETTGLGGGAGIYAFMVGVGVVEDDAFLVHQLFMRSPSEEPALLTALAALLEERDLIVTFNGRGFDLPLLRGRYRQNRRHTPAEAQRMPLLDERAPHLDLLPPARRLWRRRLQSCRLVNLEQHVLGLARSEDDVPGSEIPRLYVEYVRSGDAQEMRRVFYHNREDILSMVSLGAHLANAFCPAADDPARSPLPGEDWLALGCCYERDGHLAAAETAYRRSLEMLAPAQAGDAFARLGALYKRQGRWDEACAVWQRWLSSVPGGDVTPYVELAKHCEWRLGDLEQAQMWAEWALHGLRTGPPAAASVHDAGAVAELEHRLARLRRKRADESAATQTKPPYGG